MLNDNEKVKLLLELYKYVYDKTSSFYEDSIGIDLSYITLSILLDKKCELHPNAAIVKILYEKYDPLHVIWRFVTVEPLVFCTYCKHDIPLADAYFCPPLDGWLGYYCCTESNVEGFNIPIPTDDYAEFSISFDKEK